MSMNRKIAISAALSALAVIAALGAWPYFNATQTPVIGDACVKTKDGSLAVTGAGVLVSCQNDVDWKPAK